MKKTTGIVFTIILTAVGAFAQTTATNYKAKSDATKADPAAYNMLKEARSTSRVFPTDFGGYSADVTLNDNGTIHRGTVDYTPKVALQVAMKSLTEAEGKRFETDLNSLITHRRGGDFTKGDGRYPITFGTDDKSPLGRLLLLNEKMNSSYRIRDNQVVQVTRTFDGEKIDINILETFQTENGQFLPKQFVATFADPKTGAVKRVLSYTDRYEQVGGVWLPRSRRVITTENGVTTARLTEFSNFKVKAVESQAVK